MFTPPVLVAGSSGDSTHQFMQNKTDKPKNAAAVALGRMAAGKPKTITPARRAQLQAIGARLAQWNADRATKIANAEIQTLLENRGLAGGLPVETPANATATPGK